MIFCRPKDKVTHCAKEILNDGDGNGTKIVGMGTHYAGTGHSRCMGTGRGWGLIQWGWG